MDAIIVDDEHTSFCIKIKDVFKVFARLFAILSQLEFSRALLELVFQIGTDLKRPLSDGVIKVTNDSRDIYCIEFAAAKNYGKNG